MPPPASTFSAPGLGCAPKVGAPRRRFLLHPRVRRPGTPRGQLTMVTRAAVAPLPGPAAGELGWNAGSWANFKSWFASPKTGSRHPSTHRSQWEPWGDSIQAGSAALGEGEKEAT